MFDVWNDKVYIICLNVYIFLRDCSVGTTIGLWKNKHSSWIVLSDVSTKIEVNATRAGESGNQEKLNSIKVVCR